eukprot:4942812-Pyramimonas_sp.AAC.1
MCPAVSTTDRRNGLGECPSTELLSNKLGAWPFPRHPNGQERGPRLFHTTRRGPGEQRASLAVVGSRPRARSDAPDNPTRPTPRVSRLADVLLPPPRASLAVGSRPLIRCA